jgi:hypothetical protein
LFFTFYFAIKKDTLVVFSSLFGEKSEDSGNCGDLATHTLTAVHICIAFWLGRQLEDIIQVVGNLDPVQ